MRDVKSQVNEIYDFLSAYKANLSAEPTIKNAVTKTYRKFHSILIWQNHFDSSNVVSHDAKLYLNEAVSDMSQALLCSLLGLYKPSRVMLRTAIENVMRVSTLLYGMKVLDLKTVHELTTLFKSTGLRNDKTTDKAVQTIIAMYGELCGYVHTSSPMNMAQRIPFAKIFEVDDGEKLSCLADIQKASDAANHIISFQCPQSFGHMHHRDADFIRDQIPAALKRVVSQLH